MLTTRLSDTLKLYTRAHGAKVCGQELAQCCDDNAPMKTTNLIINLDHDDWILNNENENLGVVGFGTFCQWLLSLSPAVNYGIRE